MQQLCRKILTGLSLLGSLCGVVAFAAGNAHAQCTPPPLFSVGPDTTICAGSDLTITVPVAATGYVWSTGDTTQSITVNAAGTYSVRAYNGALSCATDDTIVVTTRPTPTVNLGNDTTVCGNIASLVLNAGNPGATYLWAGNLSTAPTLNVAPVINALNNSAPVAGGPPVFTGAVAVTDSFGCVGRDTIYITINLTPRLFDFDISGLDPTLTFTPVADSMVNSYAWSFGDGGTASTRTATHTYASSAVYTVRLIVANACGADTLEKQVQVNTAAVRDAEDDASVLLYPNPSVTESEVLVVGGAKLRGLQIMSSTGMLVRNEVLSGTQTTLNTTTLAAGVYTLRIQLDKGVVVRRLEVLK